MTNEQEASAPLDVLNDRRAGLYEIESAIHDQKVIGKQAIAAIHAANAENAPQEVVDGIVLNMRTVYAGVTQLRRRRNQIRNQIRYPEIYLPRIRVIHVIDQGGGRNHI